MSIVFVLLAGFLLAPVAIQAASVLGVCAGPLFWPF